MLKLTLYFVAILFILVALKTNIGRKGINFWRKCKILDRKSDCSYNFIATATYSGWHECNQTPVTIGAAPSEKMEKTIKTTTMTENAAAWPPTTVASTIFTFKMS